MNITFLNQWFLLGLPFAAIPIVIHLLSRKKTIIKPFSYIKFISMASLKVVRIHKIKQWLLLALRTLAIMLIVFLFARPVVHLKSFFNRGKDSSLSSVIILDNSYSVGYKSGQLSNFYIGRDAARRTLKLMEKYDRTAFLLASDRVESGVKFLTSDTNVLLEEIDNSSISYRPSNLLPAMSEAFSILKGSLSPNKQLILITDMAMNAWNEIKKEAIPRYDPKVKLIIIDSGSDNASNTAVTGINKGVITAGQLLKMKSEIANYSSGPVSNLLVTLLTGRTLEEMGQEIKADQGFINLAAEERKFKDFFYNFSSEGIYLGKVKIKNDNLIADDNYYFKAAVQEKVRVLCVDGEPGISSFNSELFYLRLALDPYEKGSAIISTTITESELKDCRLSEYSVVIAANIKEFDSSEINALYEFVKTGGNLLMFLGKNVDKGFYNDKLGSIMPGTIQGLSEQKQGWRIAYKDLEHPAIKFFTDKKQGDLSLALFYKWFKFSPEDNSKVLLRLSQSADPDNGNAGDALLIESKLPYSKSGKILFYTSTADREWNNFPAKPLFLPLLQQLISYLTEKPSGSSNMNDSVMVGENIIISLKPGYAFPSTVKITAPDNSVESIIPASNQKEIKYEKALIPGIYTIETGYDRRAVKEYAVCNIDTRSGESDLQKIKARDIKTVLPETPVITISILKELEKSLLGILHGNEASAILAIIIALILILESFIANWRKNE